MIAYKIITTLFDSDGNHSLIKSITLKAGKNISYQIHHHHAETWTFVHGEGILVFDGIERYVNAGDTLRIHVEHDHVIKALSVLTFIEV